MAKRIPCSQGLMAKSRARAEEAYNENTLVLVEMILRCECGARVGARRSTTGDMVPTRHVSRVVGSSNPCLRAETSSEILHSFL